MKGKDKEKKVKKIDNEVSPVNESPSDREALQAEINKKYNYIIKNKNVRSHMRKRNFTMALTIFLMVTIVLGGAAYGILSLINYNNFRVIIDKPGPNILSLSNNANFSSPSEMLSLGGPKYIDNVSLMDFYYKLPEIEAQEGTYNPGGDMHIKYLAATFYLKNVSDKEQRYKEAINIYDVTKNVDDALRVMLIKNGEKTVYAKAKPDGTIEEVVPGQYFTTEGRPSTTGEIWMTVPFTSPKHVMYDTGLVISPGEVIKYTILVWLEGWDEECIDSRLGGTLKLDLQFSQE